MSDVFGTSLCGPARLLFKGGYALGQLLYGSLMVGVTLLEVSANGGDKGVDAGGEALVGGVGVSRQFSYADAGFGGQFCQLASLFDEAMRELVDLVLALPPLVLVVAPEGFVFVAVPAALLGDTGGYVLNAVEGGHWSRCLDCRTCLAFEGQHCSDEMNGRLTSPPRL